MLLARASKLFTCPGPLGYPRGPRPCMLYQDIFVLYNFLTLVYVSCGWVTTSLVWFNLFQQHLQVLRYKPKFDHIYQYRNIERKRATRSLFSSDCLSSFYNFHLHFSFYFNICYESYYRYVKDKFQHGITALLDQFILEICESEKKKGKKLH